MTGNGSGDDLGATACSAGATGNGSGEDLGAAPPPADANGIGGLADDFAACDACSARRAMTPELGPDGAALEGLATDAGAFDVGERRARALARSRRRARLMAGIDGKSPRE